MGDTDALQVMARDDSKSASALRAEGLVPGIVYGKKQKPVLFSIGQNELDKFHHAVGFSTVVDLVVDGQKPIKALLHDLQIDAAKNRVQHVDFYAVMLGEKMTAHVSIEYTGKEDLEIVNTGEAVLTTLMDDVEVSANPLDLPEKITVDVTKLIQIGDTITVGQLDTGSDKAVITTDAELIVAKLDAPKEEEVDEPEVTDEEAEDGEESAEGEEASGSDAEGSEADDSSDKDS